MEKILNSLEWKTAGERLASRASASVEDFPLFEHQQRAVDFILQRGGIGALYMDMGTGKTRTTIEAFARLRTTNPDLKMIVICPLSLIESAWCEDVQRFSDFTCYNAHENPLPGELKQDILLINFESIILKRNAELYKLIKGNLLIVDEASKMKNHNARTTKTLLFLRHFPKFKIILSGTPAPNSPLEYWAQMEFLQDYILHKSFYGFRNSFFHLSRNGQKMDLRGQVMSREVMRDIMRKGWKYEITQDNLARLMRRIDPLIFRARKSDCFDLPDQVDEVRKVELTGEQARVYRDMKRDLITEIRGSFVTAQVALAKIMKLREITSGFVINTEGADIDIGAPAKLAELSDITEELGNQQVIIWASFKWDIKRIAELLRKAGKTCVCLYSGTKDREQAISDFKSGAAQYLVANPHSAAHGLTFINCSTQVFFSLDYSWEYYEQAKARIHRAGQVNKCTYIHIVAKNTIDEQILRVLRSKGDVNQIVEEYLR